MAKEQSFSEFLSWGLDDYPADNMGVIISGHGGGIAGCAYDDNYTYKYDNNYYSHTLRTFEVAKAAKTALQNSSRNKFTWIGYDCCVMQCADIASINADYFEYMIASQELEDAVGWNHDYYLNYLKQDTKLAPEKFFEYICDGFLLDKHSNTESTFCGQTLSVLDLSKMNSFTTAFNTLSDSLGSTSLFTYEKVKSAFKNSYYKLGDKVYGLCDFASLLHQLELSGYNVASTQTALNELVIYKKQCSKYSISLCGVNAFFPESMDSKYILQVGREDYSNSLSTKFTKWQNLCVAFGDFGWESI